MQLIYSVDYQDLAPYLQQLLVHKSKQVAPTSMTGMLDEIHDSLPTSRDQNSYTLGRMRTQKIVVAVMPEIGNNRAALVEM